MAIKMKQNLKTIQRLSLSTSLKNSITILGLNRIELENFITEELKKNPCLVNASKSKSTVGISYSNINLNSKEIEDITEKQSVYKHLLNQINLINLNVSEITNCKILLEYIDENGYLNTTLENISEDHNVTLDEFKFALKVIQSCEPKGVGARNIQECILIQLKSLNYIPAYTIATVENHWGDFTKYNFESIARLEKTSTESIKECFRFIRKHVDPKPARQFGNDINQVVIPDVYIFKREGQWICSLSPNGLPKIKISKKYEKILKELKEKSSDKEAIKFINENFKLGNALIHSLEERNKTILRVADAILKYQIKFFESGKQGLLPLTLKDIGIELNLHESTISRSTSGKYLFCPRGIFELKYFFNSQLESNSGQIIANESVKNWVENYIKFENKAEPLSDQDIANKILNEKNMKIARRTITKYRESLKILSSTKRINRF